jgi:hypothetical protein
VSTSAVGSGYREHLRVPVRWWVLMLLMLASLWVALAAATPPVVLLAIAAVSTGAGAAALLAYGRARVEVETHALHAGRARLEWWACGPATALDGPAARRLHGVDADPRAYLLVRPYIATAVRVDVDDPDDPTPYWLVSSRRAPRLAECINRARVLAD